MMKNQCDSNYYCLTFYNSMAILADDIFPNLRERGIINEQIGFLWWTIRLDMADRILAHFSQNKRIIFK